MTASVMSPAEKLPVPVLEHPHWRVNFRPSVYDANRLKSLAECVDVLRKTQVRLRGWSFPHLRRESELQYGDTWIAASADFMGRLEYWRFYQSAQFLYLGSVREATVPEFAAELRQAMKLHADDSVNIDAIPGFFSFTNCIYNITEYFEFAARLAQAGVYVEPLTIVISVKGVQGFMLAADTNRAWSSDYVTRVPDLNYSKPFAPADLISSTADQALECTMWFFERFGWLKPNIDAIRTAQQKLLTHQL